MPHLIRTAARLGGRTPACLGAVAVAFFAIGAAPAMAGVAWVNGIILTLLAFPLHPNRIGEQNMANQALADS